MPKRSPFPRWMRAPCIMRVVARPERAVFSAPPPVTAEVAQASLENCLNSYYPPICVRLMYRRPRPCPAPACIVLPRAAPQSERPREPREPDTAEDAGGQTDHLGQAYRGGLRKKRFYLEPPSFMSSLNPFIFSNLRSPYLDGEFDPGSGRTLAARLTHASRAVKAPSGVHKAANGRVTRGQPAPLPGIAGGNPG